MKLITLALLFTLSIIGSAWSEDADNTGENTRDQNGQTQTPIDQSNDPADIKMTAEIRKMIVADKSLSLLAKNVKIITVQGKVTLRGAVETTEEKAAIEAHAKHVGAKTIINQLKAKQLN